eukprot:TRINITY_DN12996_c0_g1_i1.p1 TRINITY_DN12996_c0_g1~~TRINITY_DN12996_c0_g1_i1.p1  ORF type:complete len:295 (+),score=55.99 TRINITY_DN12996_c0_g1_i1:37-921(+)
MKAISGTSSVVSKIRMRDGVEISARITSPQGNEAWASVVYAHGGCFYDGDRDSQMPIQEMLASMGLNVVSTSFRQGGAHPHPAALRDLLDVAQHTRTQLWPRLPLGVVGSSSGGYLALAMARESAAKHVAGDPGAGLELPSSFAFCVALCPVAHPGKRLQYLKSCINGTAAEDGYLVSHNAELATSMRDKQTAYWKTEEAMNAAGKELLRPGLVPTFMVLGGQDKNIPFDVVVGVQAWAKKTITVGCHGHELQAADATEPSDCYAAALKLFLQWAVRRNGDHSESSPKRPRNKL